MVEPIKSSAGLSRPSPFLYTNNLIVFNDFIPDNSFNTDFGFDSFLKLKNLLNHFEKEF